MIITREVESRKQYAIEKARLDSLISQTSFSQPIKVVADPLYYGIKMYSRVYSRDYTPFTATVDSDFDQDLVDEIADFAQEIHFSINLQFNDKVGFVTQSGRVKVWRPRVTA